MGVLEAGANGYLLKDSAFEELVTAVTAVAKGKMYLSPSIADTVVKSSLEKLDRGKQGSSVLLSGREREVLQLIAEGKSTKEIAAKLFVSTKTVESHRKQIMEKLKHSHDCRSYEIRHSRRSNFVGELTNRAVRRSRRDPEQQTV